MIQLPVPEPPTPREVVIQILAEGLWVLVVRGCKTDLPRESRERAPRDHARPISRVVGEVASDHQNRIAIR